MGADDGRAIVEQYWHAMHAGDFDRLKGLFADDVVVEWPQSGEIVRGKDACMWIFNNYPGGQPEYPEMTRLTGRDDLWVLEGIARYPDGTDYRVVSIFELRDGRIIHETDYFGALFPAPEWRMEYVERA